MRKAAASSTHAHVGTQTGPQVSAHDNAVYMNPHAMMRNRPEQAQVRGTARRLQRRRSAASWVLALGGLWLSLGTVAGGMMSGCSSDPSNSPTPEGSQTPNPTPTATPLVTPVQPTPTEVPVTPTQPLTNGARAWEITNDADVIHGPAALSRKGDFALGNQHLRVVIQKPGRVIGWGMFGGTIVDAVPMNEDGSVGPDAFGELSLFFNLSHSLRATEVWVEDDGSRSGTGKIVAEGVADIFDIIQLQGAAETYGIVVPYDINAPFDKLLIRTTYTLGADDKMVHIKTEFENSSEDDLAFPVGDIMDSGGDVEAYLPNPNKESYEVSLGDNTVSYTWGGFGEAFFSLVDFLGYFGDGVSYGYIPARTSNNETNAMSVTVSGVTVTVLESTNLLGVFTANKRTLVEVPANGSASVERWFAVGRDISSISDEYYKHIGQTTGTLSGRVLDSVSGTPLPNVRIGIVKGTDLEAPVTACYTDKDGHYQADLPPGDYGVVAVAGFDNTKDSRPSVLTPVSVSVSRDKTTEKDISLDRPAKLKLKVLNGEKGDGSTMPFRVQLYGTYTKPSSAVMDVSAENFGNGLARLDWNMDGEGTMDVKPGTYDVVISRGVEYDLIKIQGVVLTADQITEHTVTLSHVLDTDGYVSSDLHVHALNSPDSPVPMEDRVRTFVAEGVEILVPTDHDVVSDFNPTIQGMGVDTWITGLSGVEATTFNMGHFNQYPLTPHLDDLAGGALDWTDPNNLPLNVETGGPIDVGASLTNPAWSNNLTPSQMARAYDQANEGVQIAQVNHPRGDLGGYFTQIGLDLSQYGSAGETDADPITFRLPEDADLFDISPIKVLEVMNGTGSGGATEVMNDWFALLNLGFRIGGTGVSDTHSRVGSQGGNSRTFIKVPDDDVINAGLDEGFKDAFAAGLNDLHISFGAGIFITSEVVNSQGQKGIMGDLITATDGNVTLKFHAQAPNWSNIHMVNVFTNTTVTANKGDVLSFSQPADLNPEHTFADATLSEQPELVVNKVFIDETSPTAYRWDAEKEISLHFSQDTWIVVSAQGAPGELFPGLNTNNQPLGVSNPIFVDVDGNGRFDGPGPTHILPSPTEGRTQASMSRGTHARKQGKHGNDEKEAHACTHEDEFTLLKALLDAERRSVHRR